MSLGADDVATLLLDPGNGWSLLRNDQGIEGWFPSCYVKTFQPFVEIEDEGTKLMLAYSKRPCARKINTNTQGGQKSGAPGTPRRRDGGGATVKVVAKAALTYATLAANEAKGSVSIDPSKRSRKMTERLSPTWHGEGTTSGNNDRDNLPPTPGHHNELTPRALRTQEDLAAGFNAPPTEPPCAVCWLGEKRLGNSKTIALTCMRCEGWINQGWPFFQNKEPRDVEPGHPCRITNLCVHCHSVIQRDGFFVLPQVNPKPQTANHQKQKKEGGD